MLTRRHSRDTTQSKMIIISAMLNVEIASDRGSTRSRVRPLIAARVGEIVHDRFDLNGYDAFDARRVRRNLLI